MNVEQAYANRHSNIPITAEGKVAKILLDDQVPHHHQRFIIQVHSGHTVLVAHNLELAYRVPVVIGDKVEIHGTYVWNKFGGIIHNTHHYGGECVSGKCEPHKDGWINFAGVKKSANA